MKQRWSMKDFTCIHFPLLAIVLIFFCLLPFLVHQSHSRITLQHENAIAETRQLFQHTIDLRHAIASFSYETAFNIPRIQQLLWEHSRGERLAEAVRRELASEAQSIYRSLQRMGFDHLYFHDRDGTVVLRMHAPHAFGDNQQHSRAMIAAMVEKPVALSGFEGGQMTTGLRFLFPLFHQGVHVGSVEVASSSASLSREFSATLSSASYHFLVPRAAVKARVSASDFRRNYSESLMCPEFVIESALTSPDERGQLADLERALAGQRSFDCSVLMGPEPGATVLRWQEHNYQVLALPVRDFADTTIAHLVVYRKAPVIGQIKRSFWLAFTGLGVVTTLAVIFVILRIRHRLTLEQQLQQKIVLEEQREQQARDLESKNRTLERAQDELVQKTIELERSNYYKSEFLANMSHELRTPLNSILLLSSLLMRSEAEFRPEEVEKFKVIHICGKELLTMIDEVLDFSRLESGRVELHLEPLHTSFLVDFLRSKYHYEASEKGLELVVEDQWQGSMITDSKRLLQILQNLIVNGLKFTRAGHVSLRIQPSGRADLPLSFTVCDTGIGIEQAKREIIFEAFTQADGSISREFKGTGLGLAISRNLAVLLGGTLTLQSSEMGKGSCFELLLPQESTLPD